MLRRSANSMEAENACKEEKQCQDVINSINESNHLIFFNIYTQEHFLTHMVKNSLFAGNLNFGVFNFDLNFNFIFIFNFPAFTHSVYL